MREYVYYLGMEKPSLKTTKYKAIKERIGNLIKIKSLCNNPRNYYEVRRTSQPGLRGSSFCLGADCERPDGLGGLSFPSQFLHGSQGSGGSKH